jgi:hypothetical protein
VHFLARREDIDILRKIFRVFREHFPVRLMIFHDRERHIDVFAVRVVEIRENNDMRRRDRQVFRDDQDVHAKHFPTRGQIFVVKPVRIERFRVHRDVHRENVVVLPPHIGMHAQDKDNFRAAFPVRMENEEIERLLEDV